MKVLNVGVGVIGAAYSWLLSEAGNDVSIYVREKGISINCIDYRTETNKESKLFFHPNIVEDISPKDNYDLIIVSIKHSQLKSILPILKENAGNANILFLHNNWTGTDEIDEYLQPTQYLLGFCQLLGGNKTEDGVSFAISNSKKAVTMIGETDGTDSTRLNYLFEVFNKAGLNPKKSDKIIPWLISHYAQIASLYAGILKSGGSIRLLSKNSKIFKETISAIRDSFKVCRAKGINPRKVPPHGLFYFPKFILVPILKKVFSKPDMIIIFDGHLENSPAEIKQMYFDVLNYGIKNNVKMPHYRSFEKYFEKL